MKLAPISYGATETLGRYNSNEAAIIEKTGQVEGQGILAAGTTTAIAIGKSGSLMARAIEEAGTKVAKGQAAATIMSNNAEMKDTMARNKMESDADLSMSKAMLGAATSLAQTGVRVWADYEQEQQRQETFEASMKIDQGMLDKQQEWQQTETFYADDLPDTYKGPRVDGKGNPLRIPTSSALPALYKDEATKLIAQHAAGISSEADRDQFIQKATLQTDKKYFQLSEIALKNQRTEHKALQTQEIDNLIGQGRYITAKTAVGASSMNDSEKSKYNAKINKGSEIADLTQVTMDKDVTNMRLAADHLSSDKYKGELGPLERMGWAAKMEGEINSLKVQAEGSTVANKQIVTGSINDLTKLATSGEDVDLALAGKVLAQAERMGINPVKINQLGYALKVQPKVKELNQSPALKREAILASFKANADTPAKQLFVQELEKQNDRIEQELYNDPLKHASDSGTIPTLGPMEADNPAFWIGRKRAMFQTENSFEVPAQLLTQNEATQLSKNFKSLGIQDQVAALGVWNKGLGEDGMQDLVEQINLDMPSLPMIPNLEGPVAARVLKGQKVRSENPHMVPTRLVMEDHFEELLGNYGLDDARMRLAGEEMVTNLYLAEAEQQGWFDGKVEHTPESFAEDGMFFKNKDKVNLGLIDYNGKRIMSPEKGLTSEGFDKWLFNTSPIALIGDRAMGIAPHDVMLGIHNGDYTLRQLGKTEFAVFNEDLMADLPDKSGGRLIIHYNQVPEMNLDMEVEAAQQAQFMGGGE